MQIKQIFEILESKINSRVSLKSYKVQDIFFYRKVNRKKNNITQAN